MKLQFETFEVLLERKNIKNMYLKIRPSGEIVVTANSKMELSFIKDFILSKETWIHQKLQQIANTSTVLSKDEIRYLGQTLKKRRLASNHTCFSIEADSLRQEMPPSVSEERAERLCEAWLQKQLEALIHQYMRKYWRYFEQSGIRPVEVKYRQMTSTWGVCRPVRGSITFNKRLIHEKETFIEYVVVHELCHLSHPNHSTKFYELVACLLPQWKVYAKK